MRSAEVPGHGREQLTQTMIVCLWQAPLLSLYPKVGSPGLFGPPSLTSLGAIVNIPGFSSNNIPEEDEEVNEGSRVNGDNGDGFPTSGSISNKPPVAPPRARRGVAATKAAKAKLQGEFTGA